VRPITPGRIPGYEKEPPPNEEDDRRRRRVKTGVGHVGAVCPRKSAGVHSAALGGRSDGAVGPGEVGAPCRRRCAGRLTQWAREAASARADERHDRRAAAARARCGRDVLQSPASALSTPHKGSHRAVAGALLARPGAGRLRAGAARPLGRRRAAECERHPAAQGDVASAIRRVATARPEPREARISLGRRDLREGRP